MEGDDIRTRVGEVVDIAQRFADHQMDVKGFFAERAQPLDDGSAKGEIGNKVRVHHVEVHPIRACLVHPFDFRTHLGEVTGKQ